VPPPGTAVPATIAFRPVGEDLLDAGFWQAQRDQLADGIVAQVPATEPSASAISSAARQEGEHVDFEAASARGMTMR